MNLIYAHQLMIAAAAPGNRSLKVTDRSDCRQLQRMAAAGLIEITTEGSHNVPEAVSIERLTEKGQEFLRTFASLAQPKAPLPLAPTQGASAGSPASSCAAAAAKWRNKFVEMRMKEVG